MTRRLVHQQSRGGRGGPPQKPQDKEPSRSSTAKDKDKAASAASSPHGSIPDLPRPMGELFYECTLFLYSAMALFCAYLNIYKSLWWFP